MIINTSTSNEYLPGIDDISKVSINEIDKDDLRKSQDTESSLARKQDEQN